ncbi:UV radiation resistance-associated gene protein-like, partial [Sceloporus undulatus]|uniref:UV radiation resistance-associated gene protein-like n=1 Tax=Sceloporus undulatus TaxID=8520 RepID=UPI001C4D7C0E
FFIFSSDRHHISSAIPVPKRQSSTFGGLDVGFSRSHPSPDKGLRKRANSENERLQYKTPPPSYNSALTQPIAIAGEREKKAESLSSSLDTSIDFSKENKKGDDLCNSLNGGNRSPNLSRGQQESLLRASLAINGATLPSEDHHSAASEQQCTFRGPLGADLLCTVEQAEEIMGMEATGFGTGDQLEAFNYIPVDHAVAVECDDQVLGEFEEFSRRICALNKDAPTFRRPRKGSDK